jgi:hypothetical protein
VVPSAGTTNQRVAACGLCAGAGGDPPRGREARELLHARGPLYDTAGGALGRAFPHHRASPFANPFTVKEHGRAGAMELYRQYLRDHPELVNRARTELAGQDLACWCRPDEDCHADILLAVAAGEKP